MDSQSFEKPLQGIRVLELAGLAPAPFLGLLLAVYGADVLRIDRPDIQSSSRPTADLLTTHKSGSIPLDLKSESSVAVLHALLSLSDILIDPFRPGVLDKLGVGAQTLLQQYPRLIVVRLTGFRRDGPWKDRAGHDINYLAVSGVLSLLGGTPDLPPTPPANLLADFAGGGLNAFTGVLLALLKRFTNGNGGGGSIVDANMVDGSSFLGTFARLAKKTPAWSGPRGTNLLDGGCPYYTTYECKDKGRYVAVGALEPQFFDQLLQGMGLSIQDLLPPGQTRIEDRGDKRSWPHMKTVLSAKFKEKTRDEWDDMFRGRDACVTPVLDIGELENKALAESKEKDKDFDTRIPVNITGPSNTDKTSSEAHPSDGIGYTSSGMRIGENKESVLKQWLGWEEGKDYSVDRSRGTVMRKETLKSGTRDKASKL